MLVSTMHRITGSALSTVGVMGLVWWLVAIAAGPEAYSFFMSWATSWFGMAVEVGLTWAVFQHLCSGARHLFLDIGAGYELRTNRLTALATFAV